MSDDSATQFRLMRERSRALATVLLTRRPDVSVQDVADDVGVDLLARLVPGRASGLRQFGVELRYVVEPVTVDHANKVLRPTLLKHHGYGPFPFPLVIFFFTMRDGAGWYSWVAEPVVEPDGRTRLPLRSEPDCRPLGPEAVDQIVAAVDRWYDAHFAGLTEKPTGRDGRTVKRKADPAAASAGTAGGRADRPGRRASDL